MSKRFNNDPENLVVLNNSDHRWLYKQYGNATQWAFIHEKVKLEELITQMIPKKLLILNITKQKNGF